MASKTSQIGMTEKESAVREILENGKSRAQVARELGVSKQAVSIWVRQKASGETLAGRGRPRVVPMSDEEKGEIQRIIRDSAPSDHGIAAGDNRWTFKAVRAMLKQRRNRLYNRAFLEPLMQEWGLTNPDLFPGTKKSIPAREHKEVAAHRPRRTNGDDLSYYEEQVRQTHVEMKKRGIKDEPGQGYSHGIRTGKHAKGRIQQKKKKGR